MTTTNNTDENRDLSELKGKVYHPSLRMIGPFTPLLVCASEPLSVVFLLIPCIDFFSLPGMLSRKHIPGFQKRYIALIIYSVLLRFAFEYIPAHYWIVPIILTFLVMCLWVKFAWRTWWDLYKRAQ